MDKGLSYFWKYLLLEFEINTFKGQMQAQNSASAWALKLGQNGEFQCTPK